MFILTCVENKFASLGDIAQIGIAVLTFFVIIIMIWQVRILKRQLKLNFFSEYTKRYQEIILHFPENINSTDFSFEKLDSKVKDGTMRYMRVYFDLCGEEYNLNQEEYIEKAIWNYWEDGMKSAFSKKAFKEAWIIIKKDTQYKDEFVKWVDGIMQKK